MNMTGRPKLIRTHKICKDCKILKPVSHFHTPPSKPAGNCYCKPCESIRHVAYEKRRLKIAPRLVPTVAEKLCNRCNELQPADEFYHVRTRYDGLSHFCKPCHRADNRRRRSLGVRKTIVAKYAQRPSLDNPVTFIPMRPDRIKLPRAHKPGCVVVANPGGKTW